MMRLHKLSRAVRNGTWPSFSVLKPSPPPSPEAVAPQLIRHFSVSSDAFTPNPVALEMINYATSLARNQKTEESYARGLLILEQCEAIQHDVNSKGLVELARSTLLFERCQLILSLHCFMGQNLYKTHHIDLLLYDGGSHEAAIERLEKLQDLSLCSISIKVVASEALVGIYLEHYQEDVASAVADLALRVLGSIKQEIGDGGGFPVLEARIKVLKGLIELIGGNVDSAQSMFEGAQGDGFFIGKDFLDEFSTAKEMYRKVVRAMSFCDPNYLGACNMTSEEVAIAAACALGQLEAHMGNFSDAENALTEALKKTEEHFGPNHPKLGVILTCIALMYQQKAISEHSSSLLIQEGLFRTALGLLKAPSLDVDGSSQNVHRKDIVALARGGYAETLGVQKSRKAEAERLKKWAEGVWGNRWMSLGEALELSKTCPTVPVIDTRICRVI
ncbi:hypothetical protein OROGR_026566 [Orobanche gracilis]